MRDDYRSHQEWFNHMERQHARLRKLFTWVLCLGLYGLWVWWSGR
jgi:hypothetical protein